MLLKGNHIQLRALEPTDIDLLYSWENNTEVWNVSNTQTPYSRYILEQYIQSSHQDIYTSKQLRLVIDLSSHLIGDMHQTKAIGCIDLFDYEPNHQRAGIGILIADKTEQGKGYASEALQLLIDYCFYSLNLIQVYCNITVDNEKSVTLFKRQGFEITGIKKQWIRNGEKFKDELLLQKIRS